jgi:hypothetical protein
MYTAKQVYSYTAMLDPRNITTHYNIDVYPHCNEPRARSEREGQTNTTNSDNDIIITSTVPVVSDTVDTYEAIN